MKASIQPMAINIAISDSPSRTSKRKMTGPSEYSQFRIGARHNCSVDITDHARMVRRFMDRAKAAHELHVPRLRGELPQQPHSLSNQRALAAGEPVSYDQRRSDRPRLCAGS